MFPLACIGGAWAPRAWQACNAQAHRYRDTQRGRHGTAYLACAGLCAISSEGLFPGGQRPSPSQEVPLLHGLARVYSLGLWACG